MPPDDATDYYSLSPRSPERTRRPVVTFDDDQPTAEPHRERKPWVPDPARQRQLREWLEQNRRQQLALKLAGGGLWLIVSLLLSWLTYEACVLAVVKFSSYSGIYLAPRWVPCCAAALVGLVFLGGRTRGDRLDARLHFFFPANQLPEIELIEPDTLGWLGLVEQLPVLGAPLSWICQLILLAPTTFGFAWELGARSRRLQTFDLTGAAVVLDSLIDATEKVRFDELAEIFQQYPASQILRPLYDLGGFVFLVSAPQGLTLADLRRAELVAWLQTSRPRMMTTATVLAA